MEKTMKLLPLYRLVWHRLKRFLLIALLCSRSGRTNSSDALAACKDDEWQPGRNYGDVYQLMTIATIGLLAVSRHRSMVAIK
jgi:hypothetical protein